ncbi:MAG: lipoate--protein ligase family protein, partial [Romboutsia sp.]|nr:lipoate--protein ligase family protein [Romboutsia sp.]
MLLIYNDNTNPYFNLAMEEYFLKNSTEDLFILYRNEPSVIIGKNQKTLSIVNPDYINENSIPVVRRLSGGNALFNDLGNINFAFITNSSSSYFKKLSLPIIDLFKTMGLNATFSDKNDLLLDNKKFYRNTQYNYRNKIMHHGTLFFSSKIANLSNALKVKNVNSRFTNISEHLDNKMNILEFKDLIINYISSINPNNKIYNLTKDDINQIEKLVVNKYRTYNWNFGNDTEYRFTNELKYPG